MRAFEDLTFIVMMSPLRKNDADSTHRMARILSFKLPNPGTPSEDLSHQHNCGGHASIVYACVKERQLQCFSRERESWRPGWKRISRVRDHALEPDPFGRRIGQ